MKNKMLVSAIITTHNRLHLLKEAINSVRNQTYSNIEILVVDDASTDGTKEYCEKLSDVRYLYISPSESLGANHARNVGIENSNGYYVAFLDDDDLWLPTKIEKQVEAMQMHPECDLCICGYKEEYVNDENSTITSIPYSGEVEIINISRKSLYSYYALTCEMLIRKELFTITGMFDEELQAAQEAELTIRISQVAPICRINEPLFIYRFYKNDKDRISNRLNRWKHSMYYIYEKHRELYKGLNLRERIEVKHSFYAHAVMRCAHSGRQFLRLRYMIPLRFYRILARTSELLGSHLR